MKGRVLVVAGSDLGGGAGIEADIKTATALGAYAATAITALTVQNTLGIQRIMPVPSDFVAAAMAAVLGDIGADAIKTGMLVDAATVTAVADTLDIHAPKVPLVVDPVMVSSSGTRLLSEDAVEILEAAPDRARRNHHPEHSRGGNSTGTPHRRRGEGGGGAARSRAARRGHHRWTRNRTNRPRRCRRRDRRDRAGTPGSRRPRPTKRAALLRPLRRQGSRRAWIFAPLSRAPTVSCRKRSAPRPTSGAATVRSVTFLRSSRFGRACPGHPRLYAAAIFRPA